MLIGFFKFVPGWEAEHCSNSEQTELIQSTGIFSTDLLLDKSMLFYQSFALYFR